MNDKVIFSEGNTPTEPINPNPNSKIVTDINKAMELMEKWKRNQSNKPTSANYGDTPVLYIPKKRWLKPETKPGIVDQILAATTKSEVESLLKKAAEYKGISPKTLRKAAKAVDKKLLFLK